MRFVFIFIAFAVSPTIACSQDTPETPKCNYNGSTQELNACAYQEYEAADKELNKQYKSLMTTLSETEKEALRSEQRAWLKSRDPNCKEETKDDEGGSIWVVEFYGCITTATQGRTKQLKDWKAR